MQPCENPVSRQLATELELDEIFFERFNEDLLKAWLQHYRAGDLTKADIESFIFLLTPRPILPPDLVLDKLRSLLPARLSRKVKDKAKVFRRVVRQAITAYQKEVGPVQHETVLKGQYPLYILTIDQQRYQIRLEDPRLIIRVILL